MLPFPELMRTALEVKSRSLMTGLRHTQFPRIKSRQAQFRRQSDSELKQIVQTIRKRILAGERTDDFEINLFAAVAEASRRTVGLEPFDTQILAALVMRRNKVVQMNTGEGKTLVAPFVAIASIVRGNRALVVTANPYLSSRDVEWMRPIYEFFDLEVGAVDPDMSPTDRYAAYAKPVTYVPGGELLFDYLRKHNAVTPDQDYPITRSFAIVDEIDSVLIDHGNQQYILASPIPFRSNAFTWANAAASDFLPHIHFEAQPGAKTLAFTDEGRALLRKLSADFPALEPLHAQFYLRSALQARTLYRRDFDYLVEGDNILLVSSVTGRPERSTKLPFGLQQAIEEKEGVSHSDPIHALNQMSMQGFYKGFARICGMSGSAIHNSLEFAMFYKLDVVPIPPRLPLRRDDRVDVVFRTRAEQVQAISSEVRSAVDAGRPVLVGTLAVEEAETLSATLSDAAIPHKLLTARNYQEEAEIIEHAGEPRQVTIAAKLAGRGVDIKLTEEARQAGGLHVVGFGRANDRRLDEQLAGRSGRQGDPGSSLFILSLQDDLMTIFGGPKMQEFMRHLGMEEGVPIESKFIGRRILAAQRQLILRGFSSRNWFMLLDECTRDARNALFDVRERVASAYQLRPDIDELFRRYSKRVLHGATDTEDALARTDRMAETLGLKVNADLYTSNDLTSMRQALERMLRSAYDERRARVGEAAAVRERAIVLRTLDSVWSGFLAKLLRKTEKLNLGDTAGYSSLSQLADLLPIFSGERQKLLEEADLQLVRNLFKIDDPMAMWALNTWSATPDSDAETVASGSVAAAESALQFHPETIKPEATLREYLAAIATPLKSSIAPPRSSTKSAKRSPASTPFWNEIPDLSKTSSTWPTPTFTAAASFFASANSSAPSSTISLNISSTRASFRSPPPPPSSPSPSSAPISSAASSSSPSCS